MPRGKFKKGKKMNDPITPALKMFVSNVKSIPKALRDAGSAIKQGRFGEMVYNDMNPEGKALVDAIKNKPGTKSRKYRSKRS